MQMRPDIQIATVIKAMTDVIMPAIAENNKLAAEQARLVVGMLSLMQFQLPRQFRFDRDELQRLTATTDKLSAVHTGDRNIAEAIEAANAPRQRASEILKHCQGDPSELHVAILEMRAALCALVDATAHSDDEPARARIEALVSSMSGEQLLRDRALMKLQSWEANPAALPDIDTLLAG